MPKNDIGGFFVSLGLNIDKNSWDTGNRLIDGMGNSMNKLIGSARNAAVVLAGTAIATGTVEGQVYKLSQAIGVSTETIDLWKTSAKLAGVDANSLISSMARVSEVMSRMKIDGAGLEEFAKKLGELGIVVDDVDIAKMLEMSPDEFMKDVLTKAQSALQSGYKISDVSLIVKDILGEAGQQLLIELDRQGKSMDQLLFEAGKRTYTDSQTNKEAQDFMEQFRLLKATSENLSKLFGSKVADQLTDHLKSLNDWLGEHGQQIKTGITTIADVIGGGIDKVVDFVTDEDVQEKAKKGFNVVKDSVVDTFEGTKKIVTSAAEGDGKGVIEGFQQAGKGAIAPLKAAGEAVVEGVQNSGYAKTQRSKNQAETDIRDYVKKNGYAGIKGAVTDMPYADLPKDLQEEFDKYAQKGMFGKYHWAGVVKDGIMRPDGTITQVAPDDWVFAARNVEDLAKAFVPADSTIQQGPDSLTVIADAINELARALVQPQAQNIHQSAGDYTINQTFNISSGNDMPQVLRQQAYRGTQEGLLEVMQQSSQRLELMSGTR